MHDYNSAFIEDTNEFVSLLTYENLRTADLYGFNNAPTSAGDISKRQCVSTDWVRTNGSMGSSYSPWSSYWSRSPESTNPKFAARVDYMGQMNNTTITVKDGVLACFHLA